MKKIILVVFTCLITFSFFAQDAEDVELLLEPSPHGFSLIVDAAYYPLSAPPIGGNHCASVKGPSSALDLRCVGGKSNMD